MIVVDLKKELINMENEPMLINEKDPSSKVVTLGLIIGNAIMSKHDEHDKEILKEDRNRLFDMYYERVMGKDSAEFDQDEIKIISDRIHYIYEDTLIAGQCCMYLRKSPNKE